MQAGRLAVRRAMTFAREGRWALLSFAVSAALAIALFQLCFDLFIARTPYNQDGRLYSLQWDAPDARWWGEHEPLRAQLRHAEKADDVFEWVSGLRHHSSNWTVSINDEAWAQREVGFALPGLIRGLGFHAVKGRLFQPKDFLPGAEPVVLISERLWRAQKADLVGTRFLQEKKRHRIVGVVEARGHFPRQTDVWLPFEEQDTGRGGFRLIGVTRLRAGITVAKAEARLEALFDHETCARLKCAGRLRLVSIESRQLQRRMSTYLAGVLGMVAVGALVVLNLICFFAGALADAAPGVVVHRALGASRRFVGRMLWLQAASLALALSLVGMLLAQLFLRLSWPYLEAAPAWVGPQLRGPALAGLAAIVVASSLVTAWLMRPLLASTHLAVALRRRQRHLSFVRLATSVRVAVTLQLGIAVGLTLLAAGLWRSGQPVPGLGTVLDFSDWQEFRLDPLAERHPDGAALFKFSQGIKSRLRTQGVEVTISSRSFLAPGLTAVVAPAARRNGGPPVSIRFAYVFPDYFKSLGVDLIAGQGFASATSTLPVSPGVIDEALAQRLWPASPISEVVGRRLSFGEAEEATAVVVGVVPVLDLGGPLTDEPGEPGLYFSMRDMAGYHVLFVQLGRAHGDQLTRQMLANAITSVDPLHPPSQIHTIGALMGRKLETPRFLAALFIILTLAGLLSAALGQLALMRLRVMARQQEFALRIALGASPRMLWRTLMNATGRDALVGLAVGSALGLPAYLSLAAVVPRCRIGVFDVSALLFILMCAALSCAALSARTAVNRGASSIMRA